MRFLRGFMVIRGGAYPNVGYLGGTGYIRFVILILLRR